MLSKSETRKKTGGYSGNANFLTDLEAISKALHAEKSVPRLTSSTASSRSKSVGKSQLPGPKTKPKDARSSDKDSLEKDKKASIWSWKGLKALTHVRNRRFNCCFSLLVHSIEGLPDLFNDICLVVHWKRRDGEQMTRPVRVYQGVAEFDEQLTHSCSVYGSRSGPHHSAKYEAKHFLLYVSIYDAPELDLGKHRIDLTRLLPMTLEELEEDKSSGKWTTSFRLSGKAKGATMDVSFSYVVMGNKNSELYQNGGKTHKVVGQPDERDWLSIHRTGSLPARRSSITTRSTEDIKDLHEVLPVSRSELCESVNLLYQKLDEMSNPSVEEKLDIDPLSSLVEDQKVSALTPHDADEKNCETEFEVGEFSGLDKGIEESTIEQVKSENESLENLETDISVQFPIEENAVESLSQKEEHSVSSTLKNEESLMNEPEEEKDNDYEISKVALMKELEEALNCATDLVNEELDSQDENDALNQDNYLEVKSSYRDHRKAKSLSLDDVTDLVASEFLDMLGIERSPFGLSSESEPDSPRERLLRQFENDALANGGLLNFEFDDNTSEHVSGTSESVWGTVSEDIYHPSMYESFKEMPKIDTSESMTKTRALKMEDLETEALMREWGLNEKVFQHSPPSGGFGSPINVQFEEPQKLPELSEGLGSFVQTKDGGFLRSMNPTLFRNAKSGGSLIMQVSNPVVVPAEMGSGVMDVLQGLASVGIEKLSMQANKLMPLEDITGKTIEQIAWEATLSLEGPERQDSPQHEYDTTQNVPIQKMSAKETVSRSRSSPLSKETEYVSLEDLAPLAMDKIEALSIEGLRIQSGMSNDDTPLNISTQSIGELSALKGKADNIGGSIGLDGTGGLQLLDIKDNGDDIDGLMGLSLTLDEWMKLDSGEIDEDDLVSEQTSRILAAHHATSLDHFHGRSKGEKKRGKGRKYGLLGNNFTVALMVQLRDPLRNYEPVGSPMLALVQVERVFVPPKPKICNTVSLVRSSEEEEDETRVSKKEDVTELAKEEEKVHEEQIIIPQYKITEVHVAGLKSETGKKKLWGSKNQEQSGSRWLLANGMGKKNKHPLMKSKNVGKSSFAVSSSTMVAEPGDTLWSISSRVHGTGNKWKELASLNPHIPNPNVILPANETIRLR